jgi:hypothetical protein
MVHLAPGEEKIVSACSRHRWNHTRIAVNAGEVYEIAARPGSSWKDNFIPVSAAGYESARLAPFRRFLRRPDAQWFKLIGGVGKSESRTFRIGEGTTATIEATGELVLYANDVWFMYWNNTRSVDVVVRRVR